jgi:hypothetical protein
VIEREKETTGTVCIHMCCALRSDSNLLIDSLCVYRGIICTNFERGDELHNSVHIDVEPIAEALHIRCTVEACTIAREQG